MNHIIKFKYHIWILVFIAMGCAQFQSPKGGPRDTDPPLLIEAESEPNYQTNFVKKPIELHFNEWIKITNPTKEIVISPPTDYPIKVIEKGRRVLLEFSEDEVLKENTTYQINYGDAIKDFTEGNIIKNLVFIFSTGDVIDSLSVSGKMVDALTKEPLDNVIISLYDNLSDTAFTKTKPLYFTKTNKDGSFNLTNLRSDTFQIFGLTDNNVNYFYDRLDEKIAFNDSTILVSDLDSTFVTLELFDEEDPPRQISVKQSKSGLIKLVYSPPLQDVDITLLDADPFYTFNEIVKDTVYLWHNALELDSLTFTLKSGELSDTIMSKPAKDSFIGSNLNLDKSFVQKFNFHKEDSLNIRFNHPIKNIKLDSISVYDTVSSFNISYSEFNNRILSIKLDSLQDNSSYSFQLLPGAITDIYNNSNTDTINIPIKTNDPAQFGNMILNFESSIDTQYLVTFLKKSEAIDTFIINGPRVVNLNKLEKGVYNLKLVEDLTRDNKWSSGSYREKRAPEKIKEITLDELKPGWDLNLTIDIKDIFYGTEIK